MKISLGLKSRVVCGRSAQCLNLQLKSTFGYHEKFSLTHQVVVSRLDSQSNSFALLSAPFPLTQSK